MAATAVAATLNPLVALGAQARRATPKAGLSRHARLMAPHRGPAGTLWWFREVAAGAQAPCVTELQRLRGLPPQPLSLQDRVTDVLAMIHTKLRRELYPLTLQESS